MEATIFNIEGQEKGKIELPWMFGTKVSQSLMHEVVSGYLANQRAGTHATKTRANVSGGGHKPWRQKGTGNARAGSNRSPLWRGGGIIFGPQPHSYYHRISQQKRRSSLNMALSEKSKQGNLIILEDLQLAEPKTKNVVQILKNLKIENKKTLMVLEKINRELRKASNNIQNLLLMEVSNLSTYQVMWAEKLILSSKVIEELSKVVQEKPKEAQK